MKLRDGIGPEFRPHKRLSFRHLHRILTCLTLGLCLFACGQRDTSGKSGPDRIPKGKPPAPAENRVELASLTSTAGRLPDDVGLWETEPLKGRMQSLLEERYPVFLATFAEAKPIESIDGLLLIRGAASTRPNADRALALIDPGAGRLYLWARIEGEALERGDQGLNLPAPARDWIDGR